MELWFQSMGALPLGLLGDMSEQNEMKVEGNTEIHKGRNG